MQSYDNGDTNQWYNPGLQEGNYWTDYNGPDLDGDGVGENPYQIEGNGGNEDLYPLIKPYNSEPTRKSSGGGGCSFNKTCKVIDPLEENAGLFLPLLFLLCYMFFLRKILF